MLKPMTIILIGAIIVVIGGSISAVGTYLHNKKSSAKTDKLISIQNDLIVKSEKLVEAQNELLKYTTGGDSFGEVQLLRISDGQGSYKYTFYFKKQGEYPLYNVAITSLDRGLINKERSRKQSNELTLDDLKDYKNFNLGDISNVDGGVNFNSLLTLKEGKIHDYLFTISTRNRTFYQEFKFVVISDKLFTATKITNRGTAGKVDILIDKADDGFPGSSNGENSWNKEKQ